MIVSFSCDSCKQEKKSQLQENEVHNTDGLYYMDHNGIFPAPSPISGR